MARKTPKRKGSAKRARSRAAGRSTRTAGRTPERKRPTHRRSARKRGAEPGAVIEPGEAAETRSMLEGLDVASPATSERDGSEWDGLDVP